MDDCKGVCYELAKKDTAQCLAHDIGRAFLDLLGWASPALVVLVLAFGFDVPQAYALGASPEMVIDGNLVGDDAGSKGYMCVYCSPYTATLELIGHYSDLIQVDQEKYNKLIGGTNGFADAVERWNELTGAANEEPENSWLGGDGFIDGWLILAGKGNCYYATFTDAQVQAAKDAFEDIMAGGSGGGSGGSEVTEGAFPVYYTGNGSNSEGDVLAVELSTDAQSTFEQNIGTAKWFFTFRETGSSSAWLWRCGDRNSDVDVELVYENDKLVGIKNNGSTQIQVYNIRTYYTFDSSSKVITVSTFSSVFSHAVNAGSTYSLSNVRYCSELNGEGNGGGGGDEPDIPMPDPPDDTTPPVDAPTPPDLPTPKDPVTPRPDPPTPDPPTAGPGIDLPDPTTEVEPVNTSPTDYTPWLRAIFLELVNLHTDLGAWLQDLADEMDNHCLHIREEMAMQAAYLGDYLGGIRDEVSAQGDMLYNTIWEYAGWLAEYFDSWGEWLVEHLDFNAELNVEPYDDTSLLYWLKRIYTKLGSGSPVNGRPTDPVLNPKDTGNWLNELWETILKELAQLFPNLMIDLGLIFDDLKSKFPFSIPWDIHALLLLLVTEPVAPHFTVPMYAFTTSYELEQIGEYDIDLSFYTDYLMGVHLMLEIAWIGYMLKHTKDYMELIEAVIPS